MCLNSSSPRVRGTVMIFQQVTQIGRFIPARAGNCRMVARVPRLERIHPRACGELLGSLQKLQRSSSTHSRGAKSSWQQASSWEQPHSRQRGTSGGGGLSWRNCRLSSVSMCGALGIFYSPFSLSPVGKRRRYRRSTAAVHPVRPRSRNVSVSRRSPTPVP